METDVKVCTSCKHSFDYKDGAGLICRFGHFTRSCDYQRHPRSPCGPEGRLFEPKTVDVNKELFG